MFIYSSNGEDIAIEEETIQKIFRSIATDKLMVWCKTKAEQQNENAGAVQDKCISQFNFSFKCKIIVLQWTAFFPIPGNANGETSSIYFPSCKESK
jgi:hypothetical protein